ncbi:MAG: carboxypeptidase regulatory-like domain-containing protein, partial [Anaerolineae bacterium]|nr:carboxypeptidase regulatory-like domain-containing protein [Anaerolineae bacterium]
MMKTRVQSVLILSVVLIVCVAPAARSAGPPTSAGPTLPAATVSGVIRHGGSPVPGVTVEVKWQDGSQTLTTLADGAYSVSGVPVGSWLRIYVYPPVSMRLAFRAWQADSIAGNLTKDFDLVSGYRLQGEFRQPGGSPYSPAGTSISPIGVRLPAGEFLPPPTGQGSNQMDMVLAPAFYAIYGASLPYHVPPTILDLRSADVENQVITLLNRPLPFPEEPPVASLISVSEADVEGYATVSGAPGSVPPLVAVMILNQSANDVMITASDAAGAFGADLYAPAGSWLLIKYDPRGEILVHLWDEAFDPDKEDAFAADRSVQNLPGVTLRAGGLPAGGAGWQDFAEVGRMGWWGGWAMTGTLQARSDQGLSVLPGDTLTVTAQVRATSPQLHCTGVPTYTLLGGAGLVSLFGVDGRPMPWGTWFTTHLFTPTGLPIDHEAPTQMQGLGGFVYENLTCLSEHVLGADIQTSLTLPADLSEGIYRVRLHVQGDIPPDPSVPSLVVWHQEGFEEAFLPPIRVGEPAPPHIPWVLLLNEPVDGYRGVQALEDVGRFALPNRVRMASPVLVLPRLDERTGEPIPYRLEPGTYWISGNDRRTPNAPYIPLHLPSGDLSLQIQKPDGTQETVGPAPLLQTDIRTPSLADGSDLDESTGYMCDVYHLTTLLDEFAYTFDQDGLYTISLTGQVADIYGNPYEFHSTYEVRVARVLDIDSDQLPFTPYQQGDAFAPGLHVYPPVPAHVEISLRHLPNSDPAQEVTCTILGEANRFGYFQPPAGTEIGLDSPGEFRVDILATYTSAGGDLWAGAVTWGGVVESLTPRMSAHGRRGLNFKGDTLDDTPTWFFAAQLPPEKVGQDHWVPYFSGDIAWGTEPGAPVMDDSGLASIVTVRDLTGPSEQIYDLVRDYYSRYTVVFNHPPLDRSLAGLEKRLDVGEAPLCVATSSGIDAEADPSQVEYWGYWYAASERPDVHVREIIGEDGFGTAYWRFNDTYGYQIGEPADGDQEGDIKWNFGGAVLRVISETNPINEYAIYGSFWVLLPLDDPIGPQVTPPFQDATGASIDGGPIMTLLGQEIDMLFLPKGVRPGDVLELGDVIAFSGHVGPPLDSRVDVIITSPGGVEYTRSWHANEIGWLYDPSFDFVANQVGRWTVDVGVEHDRPYPPIGVTPQSHNTGTVLGTNGRYEFYVVDPDSPALHISAPEPGFIIWPDYEVEPIEIRGRAPAGTTAVFYTIHDKGIVMSQGSLTPGPGGTFTLVYDAKAL